MQRIYFHRYHSQTTWVENFKNMNEVNNGNLAPVLASEASSDHAKFCCVVAALLALQWATSCTYQ